MVTDTELKEFLRRVDRLVEPALLFTPKIDPERVLRAMETAFEGRPVFSLRANGPIAPSETDVAETVRNSFDGRGVLAVIVNAHAPSAVTQAVSRLCTDGVFAEHREGTWTHLKPPDDWRLIVLAEVESPDVLPGGLVDCFPAVMAL